ncbi:ABC-type transport auxiliary lipoprotein family protein [Kordiimonas laminariae]|uniref:ABC-type transport auxiliary lipoprotein family protein n=1 Tax=Kordiimonas laminariae TaxID=2917717 RepID=UPI001FF5DBFA|nr:ABC-type transport auxiliary lipoprotein family protein [Kordiimonas laminariae]MCK0069173.1 ABC-type transport auxiliary lipoprotein family protein [Kordiimonas laminariae]
MMHKLLKTAKLGTALGLMAVVGGCGPLISFGDDGPADEVYTLEYPKIASSNTNDGATMYVSHPVMSSGIDGTEVVVALDNNKRTVLKGVSWAGHLSDLMQDYLVHSLRAETVANIVSDKGLDVRVNCRMDVKVWKMEFAPSADGSSDMVNIEIELSLIRLQDAYLVGHPVYTRTENVVGGSHDDIVAAFNGALNDIAREHGAWVSSNLQACTS